MSEKSAGNGVKSDSTPSGRNFYWMPVLRPGETILYSGIHSTLVVLVVLGAASLFFGAGALSFYTDYYVFDSLREACGDQPWRDCGKFYNAASWIVPVGSFVACIALVFSVATLVGWMGQMYIVTSERALVRRYGLVPGIDSIELKDATIRKRWVGVQFKVGWRTIFFYLDHTQSEVVLGCLKQQTGP